MWQFLTSIPTDFTFTNWMGILLYWVPFSLCVFGYTVRTHLNVQKDLAARAAKPDNYYPTDTVGTLIGRGVVTVIPVANLWAALFDVAPKLFCRLFNWFDKAFNQPLVPRRK
jgi:hypothetical protein